jgi:hypothetical protein
MTVREAFRRLRAEQWATHNAFLVAMSEILEDRVAVITNVTVDGRAGDLYMITGFAWVGQRKFYNLHRAVCFGYIRVAPIVAPDYDGPWLDPAEYRGSLYRKVSEKMREALG